MEKTGVVALVQPGLTAGWQSRRWNAATFRDLYWMKHWKFIGIQKGTVLLYSLAWPDSTFVQGVYRLQYKRPHEKGLEQFIWSTGSDTSKCQYAQRVTTLSSAWSVKFKTNTCSNSTGMTRHWISWSIYTYHHSDGSCTSGCCELFQTLFAWVLILQAINALDEYRVWPRETSDYIGTNTF